MQLLVDLFGYLEVLVHGLVAVAQAVTFGSVFFLLLLARPLAARLADGPGGRAGLGGQDGTGQDLPGRVAAVARNGAVVLAIAEGLTLLMQAAVLDATMGLTPAAILPADFALAGLVKIASALGLAVLLRRGPGAASGPALAALSLVGLAAATATTHAAARVDDRPVLLALSFLHQFGAALWIGGIPVFLLALNRLEDAASWRTAGARFSRISMAGVVAILASGGALSLFYIGDLPGLYGTAYGVMVAAKAAMLGCLLLLGFGNFLVVERLRASAVTPIGRMKRFAEAEIGIGVAVFFAAASLTSVPPAVDLVHDRVGWSEIVERYTPRPPRLHSPDHDALALSRLQAELDRSGAGPERPGAFVPGGGEAPPRNAADVAWSEYNHNWAGFFVVLAALGALAAQAGWRIGRHWPLAFAALGLFLVIRADPDAWPLGSQGFGESLRDVETLQHRLFLVLIAGVVFFEWRVRVRDIRRGPTPLVFPLVCAAGGTLLLTHQHALANVREELLVELSHTPLALAGIVAGWARWLELRLDGPADARLRRIAAWTWPVCLLVVGLILVIYRET